MATPRKNPSGERTLPGPVRPKVLNDAQYALLLKKIGPQPDESDDLDQHMLWAAKRTQAHVLNLGTRDSLIIADKIIKANKPLDGVKAPPGKTAMAAAQTPQKRNTES